MIAWREGVRRARLLILINVAGYRRISLEFPAVRDTVRVR
jgi:hypothetical protein